MSDAIDSLLAKCTKMLEEYMYEDAERELNIAVTMAPENPEAWHLLGVCYLLQNKLGDAERAYKHAVEIEPSNARYLQSLGSTLGHLQRFTEAEEFLRKAIELRPDDARSWGSLASSLLNLNRHDEAIEASRKAVELDPKSYDAFFTMSLAYFYKGQLDQAEVHMKTVLGIVPQLSQGWAVLAEIYKRSGRDAEAANVLEKLNELTK